jgi:hypothetical protein
MAGGGQLVLIAVGAQNQQFNGNPQETFFYKVFKRHTHFAQESITIPVDGPNELVMDSQIRLRAKIPRHADLMADLTFVFDLPEMYSKFYGDLERTPAFRWIHQIGAHMIQNAAIFIGGTKIQEFAGEWFAIRATVDYTADKYLKWRTMVGDVPELHTPEWGVYGKSPNYPYQRGEYPSAIYDASGNGSQAPSVPARTIRVPLPFWFTESWGVALPLVALQLHEVEVQLTLRPLRELYRIAEMEFDTEPVRPGRMLVNDPRYPTRYDPTMPTPPYENLTLQNIYQTTDNDQLAWINNYFTAESPTGTLPTLQTFNMNPRLEATYLYVTQKEQIMFAERALNYLVHQVQTFVNSTVTTRTRFDLELHGLLHRIIFFGRRSDAIDSRNDYLNMSNWKSLVQAPYAPLSPSILQPNSGMAIPYYGDRDVLSSARLLIAGNEIYEEKSAQFLEVQSAFTHGEGSGIAGLNPGAIKADDVIGPIYQFPFALNMSDHTQPSGSLNSSRVREVQLEVNPTPLDPAGYYVYDFTVYVETMNLVKIQNGMGALAWAI